LRGLGVPTKDIENLEVKNWIFEFS
jgi:hypothetical protein